MRIDSYKNIALCLGLLCTFNALSEVSLNGELNEPDDMNSEMVTTNQEDPNYLYPHISSTGFAGFAAGVAIWTDKDNTSSLVLKDINKDGHLDLVAGNVNKTNKLYLGDGMGGFFPREGIEGIEGIENIGSDMDFTTSMAVGDVDGDGRLDVIAGNLNQTNKMYLGDGSGGFAPANKIGSEADDTNSVVLGDVNKDGRLDLIVGNHTHGIKLYLNISFGGFAAFDSAKTIPSIGPTNSETQSLALGDVDGDGDLDLIAGNKLKTNKLYLGDGKGGFSAGADIGTDMDETLSVVLGDVDGDGDLDIIAGNFNQNNTLYLGKAGGFSKGTDIDRGEDDTKSVELGDVDCDGDLDMIAGNDVRTTKLYLGDGKGGFSAGADIGTDMDETQSVVLGDVDDDGDLDLITGNIESNKLYRNLGCGDPIYKNGFEQTN